MGCEDERMETFVLRTQSRKRDVVTQNVCIKDFVTQKVCIKDFVTQKVFFKDVVTQNVCIKDVVTQNVLYYRRRHAKRLY